MENISTKLWGGRFTTQINSTLNKFNNSLNIDSRLYSEDLNASKAYAEALKHAGLLSVDECDKIQKGLDLVRFEWVEKSIKFELSDEDVHTVNERLLVQTIGKIGEKLHTGRSRNDQIVTDMRLWMKKAIRETFRDIEKLLNATIDVAEREITVIMPGYTHLQRAQPILFSHWLLSYSFAFQEDYCRLQDLLRRVDVLPLGSGALAGNPFEIDREFLAKRLGFSKISQNSMHAVSNRDFMIEFNFVATSIALHLSRFAEDLILYSTKEFNFITISDDFSTGSSLMPQKRNPDSLELIRGTSGDIFGSLTGLMMSVKGLPSTYNKDLQFDKKSVFNVFDQLQQILVIMTGVVGNLKINETNAESALSEDMLATDWAYYLVRKGIPFRTAHHLVGKVVALAEERKIDMNKLPLKLIKSICDKFDDDVFEICDFRRSIEQYSVTGGTSTNSVRKQISILKNFLFHGKNDNNSNKINS